MWKIKNKSLFYTGLGFQLLIIFIGICYGLSILFSMEFMRILIAIIFDASKLKYYLIGLFFILYEGASFIMMWAGCKK